MPAYQYDYPQKLILELIKAAQKIFNEGKPFCLVRLPGEDLELFAFASKTKPRLEEYFVVKGWDSGSDAVYFSKQPVTSDGIDGVVGPNTPVRETDYETYTVQFRNYLENFKIRGIQKAILSRIKVVEMEKGFDVFSALERACQKYPETLTYIVNHPTEGLWLGASPEILLQKRKRWKTVSLAGTQRKKNSEYTWGAKEKQEQELVSVHIRERLASIGAKYICESGVETATSGAVAHLKTFFEFDSDATVDEIVKSFHPTPAIAGLPVKEAIRLISETETHQRRLYTGYLGRISREKVDLYVNLRCMQVFEGKLVLYLGGGITPQSNLESEWEETEMKAQTLLNITHGKQEN